MAANARWILLHAAVLLWPAAALAQVSEEPDHDLICVRTPAGARPLHARPGFQPGTRYLVPSQIVRFSPASREEVVLTSGFHSACDPAVDFDGGHILFAGKKELWDAWQIWRVDRDGGDLAQITSGPCDHMAPLYVGSLFHLDDERPTRRLVYMGAEPGVADEAGTGHQFALYASNLDGSAPWRITHNLSADFEPDVLPNGRVVFSSWRWKGVGPGAQPVVGLMAVNNDGTDLMPYSGNHEPPLWKHMVCVGSDGRVYFVESDSPDWLGGGDLAFVRQRRPLRSHTTLARAETGWFHSPRPLQDGGLLVSYRSQDDDSCYAIWRMAPETGERLDLVYEASGFHCIDAQELAPRPPVKGRSSVVDMGRKTGLLFCLSAHLSDRPGIRDLDPRSVRKVRVIEGLPLDRKHLRSGTAGSVFPGEAEGSGPLTPRRLLGVVPLEEDGSFHIEVPAQVPITFQLLDEHGMAVASQHSWTWVMPREWRGCVGCHEDREMVAPNVLAQAVVKPAKKLTLPPERRRTVDFVHQIAPIVTAKCARCHGTDGPEPRLSVLASASDDDEQRGAQLAVYRRLTVRRPDGRRLVDRGSARTSSLIRHVFGEETATTPEVPPERRLDTIERTIFVEWVDLGAPFDVRRAWTSPSACPKPGKGSER